MCENIRTTKQHRTRKAQLHTGLPLNNISTMSGPNNRAAYRAAPPKRIRHDGGDLDPLLYRATGTNRTAAPSGPSSKAIKWGVALDALLPVWREIDQQDISLRPRRWGYLSSCRSVLLNLDLMLSHVRGAIDCMSTANGRLHSVAEHIEISVLTAYVLEVINVYVEFGYPNQQQAGEFVAFVNAIRETTGGVVTFNTPRSVQPLRGMLDRLAVLIGQATKSGLPDGRVFFNLAPNVKFGMISDCLQHMQTVTNPALMSNGYPLSFLTPCAPAGTLFGTVLPNYPLGGRQLAPMQTLNGQLLMLLSKNRAILTCQDAPIIEVGTITAGPWRNAAPMLHILRHRSMGTEKSLSVTECSRILTASSTDDIVSGEPPADDAEDDTNYERLVADQMEGETVKFVPWPVDETNNGNGHGNGNGDSNAGTKINTGEAGTSNGPASTNTGATGAGNQGTTFATVAAAGHAAAGAAAATGAAATAAGTATATATTGAAAMMTTTTTGERQKNARSAEDLDPEDLLKSPTHD